MKPQIVVSGLMPPDVVARARAEFDTLAVEGSKDMTLEEALQALARHRADGLLLTSTLKLDGAAILRLPAHVKVAATSSVGFDHIDVPAAKARGLIVTNTPDVLTDATADLAFMLILAACRRAHEYRRSDARRMAEAVRARRHARHRGKRPNARHPRHGANRARSRQARARLWYGRRVPRTGAGSPPIWRKAPSSSRSSATCCRAAKF